MAIAKTPQTKEVSISFAQSDMYDEGVTKGKLELFYNLTPCNGGFKRGMGFEKLASSVDRVNIEDEEVFALRGEQIKAINQLCWHDSYSKTTSYYIFYYNSEGEICHDSLFDERFIPIHLDTDFTDIPIAIPYKKDDKEYLIFSGNGSTVMIGDGTTALENVPPLLSCVNHYGMFFAIKINTPPKLVYSSQTDITLWDDELLQDLDFSDPRGDLTKLISFNDYVYIFRSYGITQLSKYSADEMFSVSHMYQACSYIHPDSICVYKDMVYFVEGTILKAFNGNSVKDVEVKAFEYMKDVPNMNLCACVYQGRYYLACRCDFGDGVLVGCEGNEGGYTNNTLISYDLTTGREEILRGVDISQIMNFLSPFKSKLLATFRNQHIDKIGQLTSDGEIFGEAIGGKLQSTFIDFGSKSAIKRLTSIVFKCRGEVNCKIIYDGRERVLSLKGEDKIKTQRLSLSGREFKFVLTGDAPFEIDNFVVTAKVFGEN